MTKRKPYTPTPGGKINNPLLTHMRATAYAPVPAVDHREEGLDAISAARAKRERKAQARKNARTSPETIG